MTSLAAFYEPDQRIRSDGGEFLQGRLFNSWRELKNSSNTKATINFLPPTVPWNLAVRP